jgi:hypothetical protein
VCESRCVGSTSGGNPATYATQSAQCRGVTCHSLQEKIVVENGRDGLDELAKELSVARTVYLCNAFTR